MVAAVLGSHDSSGTSGQRLCGARNGTVSSGCLKARSSHLHAALLSRVGMVFFRLGAGSGRKLWFSFDGSLKGWGLIMGWELIMQQVQTPRLAVQPQTAGAQHLWGVGTPQCWSSRDPLPLPGARRDHQHSLAFLFPFWLVVLIAELALVLHLFLFAFTVFSRFCLCL